MMGDRFSVSVYVQQKESMHLHETSQRRVLRHLQELDGTAGSKRRLWDRFRSRDSRSVNSGHLQGLRNRGLIQISEDGMTGDFVITVGKGMRGQWGVSNVPQGLWRIACKKEDVREAVDELLVEKILSD